MIVKQYKERVRVVEAIQFDGENLSELRDFCGKERIGNDEKGLLIFHQDDVMKPELKKGDWVCRFSWGGLLWHDGEWFNRLFIEVTTPEQLRDTDRNA